MVALTSRRENFTTFLDFACHGYFVKVVLKPVVILNLKPIYSIVCRRGKMSMGIRCYSHFGAKPIDQQLNLVQSKIKTDKRIRKTYFLLPGL